jgi:aminoglycoside/choline kinase family phosphotransferase
MAPPSSDLNTPEQRQQALQSWFNSLLPDLENTSDSITIKPLSGDASFRRYFTGTSRMRTYVLVDAPPDKEDSRNFVQVARQFEAAGINVPHVYEADFEQGFMCLSWLGDTLLGEHLQALKNANHLAAVKTVYHRAFDSLLKIQSIREGSDILLPPFDGGLLLREMELFREWFCGGIMQLNLSRAEERVLDHFFDTLIDAALSQPQVVVHRDYHSRNLMYQPEGDLGVLDFQDAVIGPFTYDLVSLIKDCYISWPRPLIRDWAVSYANMAQTAGIVDSFEERTFLRSFDLMGVQRHLKATGIFSRLYLRDGKPGYLGDIPRTLAYVKEVLSENEDFIEVGKWFESQIYPLLWTRLKSHLGRGQAT